MFRRQGFTLIEIIVVLLIIAVAVGFFLPNFTQPNQQALATNAVNNLLAIYSAEQNYFNNHGSYYISPAPPANDLTGINSNLSLNIQDNGSYTYYCDTWSGGPPAVYGCHAKNTNTNYTVNPITVFLNGGSAPILFPLSRNVDNLINANPYTPDCQIATATPACPF